MSEAFRELAERAIASKHWRWKEGMRLRSLRIYLRIVGCNADGSYRLSWDDPGRPVEGDSYTAEDLAKATPDLTDPATVGCLLTLVREACEPNRAPGDWPMLCTYQSQAKKWGVGAWLNESGKATFAALVLPSFDTEAEALVAALEAAP